MMLEWAPDIGSWECADLYPLVPGMLLGHYWGHGQWGRGPEQRPHQVFDSVN